MLGTRPKDIAWEAFDWQEVFQQAVGHGVLASLAVFLADQHVLRGDADLHQFVTEYPRRVRAKNKFLTQELVQVQGWLREAGVQSLVFKGPPLASLGYGGLDRRTCVDLDLIISPDAFHDAKQVLHENGYRYSSPVNGPLGERARQFFDRQHTFTRGQNVFQLDLHTGIMPPLYMYKPEFENLLSRAHSVEIEGWKVRSLAPPDLLLALCHQGQKDRWNRLKYVHDVAVVVPLLEDTWTSLLQRAKSEGSLRVLYMGLYLAYSLLDVRLPDDVREAIKRDGRVALIGDWAIEKMSRRLRQPTDSLWERVRLHTLIQDSIGGTMRYTFFAGLRKLWYYTDLLLSGGR